MRSKKRYLVIYTDGSCYWKIRKGGYGVYFEWMEGNQVLASKRIKGNQGKGYSNTTIDRMEIRAVIIGLEAIKHSKRSNTRILVVTDRKAVVNTINEGWVFNWEKENFFDRKNKDLWIRFLNVYRTFNTQLLTFKHTRGHNKGIEAFRRGNNIADELADYKSFSTFIEDEEGVL